MLLREPGLRRAFRREPARELRIREGRDRCGRADEHDIADAGEQRHGVLGAIGHARRSRTAPLRVSRAAAIMSCSGRAPVAAQMRCRAATPRASPAAARTMSAQRGAAFAQHRSRCGQSRPDPASPAREPAGAPRGPGSCPQAISAGRTSVAICPGCTARGGDGGGAIGRQRVRGLRHAQPVRHRSRERLDVGLERAVPALVRGGVIADDVDDGALRPPRVVQVGGGIREAGAEVVQRQRGLAGDARIAIGHATDRALEQPQDRPDPGQRRRAPRRNASPRCRGSRSTPRCPQRPAYAAGSRRR